MTQMTKTRALLLPILLVFLALSFGLSACGGGDEESTSAETSASAPEEQTSTTPAEQGRGEKEGSQPSGGEKGKGSSSSEGDQGGSSASPEDEEPDSLETNPAAIRGARVTSKGAVQTLPPSDEAHVEAMENSYSSIKAFGEESEGSEATDITFALTQYLNAKASGDWATACARIYSVLRDNIAKLAEKSKDPAITAGGCPAAFGTLMERGSPATFAEEAKIDVASVRRGEDNRAFVIYKTPKTLSADMPMYLEGDVWTVGAIQAYSLTPEQLRENQG
jgi:hypothetical protein